MQRKQFTFLALSLLAVVLVVAACAPRAGNGDTLEMPGSSALTLDLPALVVDFDSDGQPSVASLPLTVLSDQFAPGALDSLVVPAEVIQYMTDSNIQHLQISNSPNGLILQINGKSVPSLKWDGEELQNTAQVVDLLGADLGAGMAMLETFLPLVSHLGIGLIARFPKPVDVAEIPLYVADDNNTGLAAHQAQENFLAAVQSPPSVSVPIYYDAQGSWRVGDLTYAEWISLTGMPVFDSFRLRPEVVDRLMKQGITEFTLATDVDGIHVIINGKDLPYIGWADGELSNALDLAKQVGIWDSLSAQNMNVNDVVAMIEMLLPVVQTTQITITAHFPESIASSSTN